MKILAVGIAEAGILMLSLPALSDNRPLRVTGGGLILASGLFSIGAAALVSDMKSQERTQAVMYGAGLIATGLYAGYAPDSHPRSARFGGSFLGMNTALGLGIVVPLLIF
jgi:predicted membrane protein